MKEVIVMKTAAVWFRRDLRLQDHTALSEAVKWAEEHNGKLFLFFQLNPAFLEKPADFRHHYFFQTLKAFMDNCRDHKIAFHLMYGETEEIMEMVIEKVPEINLFLFNEDETGYGKERDDKVKRVLKENEVDYWTFQDHFLHGAREVKKQDGSLYKVYTPYYKAWSKLEKKQPAEIDLKKLKSCSVSIQDLPDTGAEKLEEMIGSLEEREDIGEEAALKTLKEFTDEKLEDYHKKRDLPAEAGTSRLSRYLNTGTISIRTVYHHIMQTEDHPQDTGKETFIKELAWRDFYNMVYVQFPNSVKEEADKRYRSIKWNTDKERLKAWKEGKTGYPIVDAGMRQLNEEGWMHNRLRMITASFLTKDYLLDWRLGEAYFAEKLVDYEPGSNIGGWQWAASVGTDPVPYFRVFNPVTQSKKFDPDGEYIKKYVPELRDVDVKRIHEPWKMSSGEQKEAGCIIGTDYPEPTVNHSEQRVKAIEMFQGI